MTEQERELASYEASLRREEMLWQHYANEFARSDGHAVQTGIVALRTAILLNSGAIIALMALAGRIIDFGNNVAISIFNRVDLYLVGLVCAMFAAGTAYLYQSFVTAENFNKWQRSDVTTNDSAKAKSYQRPINGVALFMVMLVLASYALFVVASFRVFAEVTRAMAT